MLKKYRNFMDFSSIFAFDTLNCIVYTLEVCILIKMALVFHFVQVSEM